MNIYSSFIGIFLSFFLCFTSSARPFKIGFITDVHLVPHFDPWSKYDYDFLSPVNAFTRSSTYAPLGRLGAQSPLILFKSALTKMKELINSPDLIILGGDYVTGWDNMQYSVDPMVLTKYKWIKQSLKEVAQETENLFPGIPIGYVIGNHDKLWQPKVPISWMPFKKNEYTFIYDLWLKSSKNNHKWDTEGNKQTMIDGLYWEITLPEVNFLSINANYFHPSVRDPETRQRQIDWLRLKLREAKSNNKKVLIGSHIPLQDLGDYEEVFSHLLQEYKDIISITLTGHLHNLNFYTNTKDGKSPFDNEIANQALTPNDLYNPAFAIYNFDTGNNSFIPLKFKQYAMELTKTYNKTDCGLGLKYWVELFDSEEDLGLRTLGPLDISQLLTHMKESSKLLMDFQFFNRNHRPLRVDRESDINPSNSKEEINISFSQIPGEKGYLQASIDGDEMSQHSWMFYWLFRSKMNPQQAPLIIYLEGGPGCAGELLMLNSISPIILGSAQGSTPELIENKYSWDNIANILIIDQPISGGLSSMRNNDEIPDSINAATENLFAFLNSFYKKYPELIGRETYFVGSDYSFHIIAKLIKMVSNTKNISMKIGGFAFIRPLIDGIPQYRGMINSAKEKGLLNPISSISSKIGGALCSIYKSINLESFAEFTCKMSRKTVEGQNNSNIKQSKNNILLDPNIESRFMSYMKKEVDKTKGSYPFLSRCSSYLSQSPLKFDILEDYTKELGEIMGLGLPLLLVYGENDLWSNRNIYTQIFKKSGWKYYQEIKSAQWKNWKLGGKIIANSFSIKDSALTMVEILGAGEYPLIYNNQFTFDLISMLIFA